MAIDVKLQNPSETKLSLVERIQFELYSLANRFFYHEYKLNKDIEPNDNYTCPLHPGELLGPIKLRTSQGEWYVLGRCHQHYRQVYPIFNKPNYFGG